MMSYRGGVMAACALGLSCGSTTPVPDPPAATPDGGRSAAPVDAGGDVPEPFAWPVPSAPGFSVAGAKEQARLEATFLAVPSAASVDGTVAALTTVPHAAGTPGMEQTANQIAATLRDLGFDVSLAEYEVYLPRPRTVRVKVTGKRGWTVTTREPSRVAAKGPDLLTWNQYAANGKVSAPIVYAGFGQPDDFTALAARKVDLHGKVALIRYGKTYRGAKVRLAEQAGAAAVLLYSDPAEDGFAKGEVLPAGPQRPPETVQRGTVVYQFLAAGDPLTPGRPSVPGVERDAIADAVTLPRIPVVTIPAADAERLLRAMTGPVAAGKQGAFGFTYHHGPGATVEVTVDADDERRTIRNVIATMPGASPAEVILGNHIDAWVFGAVDPHSGTSAMLEIARGLAALRTSGWTPRRTVTLAFWDAEEPGVVGSAEWVEEHLVRLREHAVAYLNVDTFAAGTLDVAGSPALTDLVAAAAEAVADPVSGKPLAVAWRDKQRDGWRKRWEGKPAAERVAFAAQLGDLGAGSDWTAFLHHAGVPSLQWTMNGAGTYAVYHSAYDDHAYARTWADPEFRYAPAFAQVMGLAALRLVEAEVLPFRHVATADRIDAWIDGLVAASLDGDGIPRVAMEVAPLRAAAARLRVAALAAEALQLEALAGGGAVDALDLALPRVEQAFLDDQGHPGRPWFRHVLTAPSLTSGFDPVALPAAVDALLAGDVAALAAAIAASAAAIERGAAVLEAAVGSP